LGACIHEGILLPVTDIDDLKQVVAKNTRLLGLDLGAKTIGLAISDGAFHMSTPLDTIRRKKFTHDAIQLQAIIETRQIGGLILGLPINMDGTEGPRCQSTRQFAANFIDKYDIPIAFWDERLSTAAVERDLIAADVSRAKRALVIDQMAASFILQGALDYLNKPTL
jgi:putative Holliday junction resolvase